MLKAIVALLEQLSSERFHMLVRNGLEVVRKKMAKETLPYIPCGWLVLEKASVDSSVVYAARKSYLWEHYGCQAGRRTRGGVVWA